MTTPALPNGFHSAQPDRSLDRHLRPVRQSGLIIAVYLGAYVALHYLAALFHTPQGISPWYPPAALSLVLVLWGGRRYIPLLFVASMLVEGLGNSLTTSPISSFVLSLILTLGYASAGLMLRYVVQLNPDLCRLRDVLWMVGVGIIFTPFVVAVSAVGTLAMLDTIAPEAIRSSILTFWIGDAIGIATFAPWLLALLGRVNANPRWLNILPGKINLELCTQFLSIVALVWLGLRFQYLQAISSFYFCVLPLLWVAIRQGFFRTTFAVFVTNSTLIAFLIEPNTSALQLDLQMFMFTISLTGLIIGAVVTERQRFENDLHQSERYFRSLIENASDFITIVDHHGTVHYESPSTQRVFGYPQGLVGKNVFHYIHPDDCSRIRAAFEGKLSGQELGHPVHYRFRNCDGSWRYLESAGNEFRSTSNPETWLVINSRDVTERRRVEEALATLAQGAVSTTDNDFYRTLVLQLSLALQIQYAYVGLYDQDCQQITMIAACDAGIMRESFSFPIAGMACEAVITQGTSVFASAVQSQFPNDETLHWREIEGYIGIPLVSSAQVVVGVIVVMAQEPLRDISLKLSLLSVFAHRVTAELDRTTQEADRRDMERKLLETQKLESLGLLAGGIAHDFNNFLTTIMGNLNLAMLESAADGPLLPYLNTIEIATRRAADLSRQMLAYSGKGRFIVSRMSINDLVAEMMTLLQVSIGKQIALQHEFNPDLPLVEIDATQIRQVVMNLIVNASDAIGLQAGQITLRTGIIDAANLDGLGGRLGPDQPDGCYVSIEVSDTGAGMDALTQARIFEPFFTTKFTGRGLGLAAVQGIVRSHHGILKVASEVGRGSTFKVLLPCAADSVPVAVALPPPAQTLNDGVVLVIDDEDAIRSTITRMLERLGFQTLQAASGHAGLALLQQHAEIVAVLLDMTMPDLDGETTFGAIQQAGGPIPVILMSGYSQTEITSRLVDTHLAAFIHKPFTLDELNDVVIKALKKAPIAGI
ncbi:MAG: MASE1 domain-containing protein [Herpetosiphonaceae bacterium]|nr:MASE1 domain-containing protein [Herpetosiphonaceae bacterium]